LPAKPNVFAALAEPFDEDYLEVLQKSDGFKFHNVKPEHYLARLNEAAPGQFSLEFSPVQVLGKSAFAVTAKLTLHTPDGDRISTATGTEPIINTDPDSIANAVKAAQSDAVKLAGKTFGLGLYLYGLDIDEDAPVKKIKSGAVKAKPAPAEDPDDDEDEAPAPRRSSKPSGKGGKTWTGDLTINFGKFKGEAFNSDEVDCGYIQFMLDKFNEDPEKNATAIDMFSKEKKRRQDADIWEVKAKKKFGSKAPAKKRRVDPDDEETDDDF
jgi:hypothetical protein